MNPEPSLYAWPSAERAWRLASGHVPRAIFQRCINCEKGLLCGAGLFSLHAGDTELTVLAERLDARRQSG